MTERESSMEIANTIWASINSVTGMVESVRERGNRAPAGPGASVTVLWDSGRPWDYPRTIGQAYKQLSIFVDAAKLADQYGLRSTGFLRSGTGFSEAGRTRGRLFRCRFAEGMAGARRRVSMPFQ